MHDRVHQDHEHQCEIGHEQSASPSEPTQQELNGNFPRTRKLLEQHGKQHVRRSVDLMCQADSSGRFLPNAHAVRDAMGQFDQSTHTCFQCSHVTKHMVKQEVECDISRHRNNSLNLWCEMVTWWQIGQSPRNHSGCGTGPRSISGPSSSTRRSVRTLLDQCHKSCRVLYRIYL